MLRNFLLIACRNLYRNKTYTAINLIGLFVGMVTIIFIGLWLKDEISFDRSIKDHDRVVRLMHHWNNKAYGTIATEDVMPIPAAGELREKYGESFDYVALARPAVTVVAHEEEVINLEGSVAEPGLLGILSPKMVEGSIEGFDRADAILISQRVADIFFKEDNVINQVLTLNNKHMVNVIGVFEDFEGNTSFSGLDFIQPWSSLLAQQPWIQSSYTHWNDNSFRLYAKLKEGADLLAVNQKIEGLLEGKPNRNDQPRVFAHPMDKWHLYGEFINGHNTGGNIYYVHLFTVIGGFVLLLACINFMNLSTARAQKRAKEVGIRKTIGSSYKQLAVFFFSESILTVVIASFFALLFVLITLPWFNLFTEKSIQFPYADGYFWLAMALFVGITGIIAGTYPALYLSSFNPIKSLKGIFMAGAGAVKPRKVLVVAQFTVSIVLIVGTLVVYKQVQYAKNRPVGYNTKGLVDIPKKTDALYNKYDLLRNEMISTGAVLNTAEASNSMTRFEATLIGFDWKDKDPNVDPEFNVSYVTHDFGNTVGWHVSRGRDFSRDFATDSAAMILNETAARFMQLENPINERVVFNDIPYRVVGVIEDVVTGSPFKQVMPAVYLLSYDMVNNITVRLNPELAPAEAIAKLAAVFKRHAPGVPIQYRFVDEEYAKKFAMEERVGRIASCFAALALLISCMGVFGLAVFVAEQRTKEIGVRKVLGATIVHVWMLLSRDFLKFILLAILLALPLSVYLTGIWLNAYEYRAAFSLSVFAFPALGVCALTLITVSLQTWRAARINPTDALRDE
ncbi:ABC transporter permease [Olivibacter sp. SDN3]|uniref:ABC transporter permease n=1 Tax=Olivibacter sp. SDN3 TaxID=2764720 RepID=UPI0016513AC0|nr:ABC transporter permease [Olivibacter sp. SDN3]QNL51037.1 ABC transporter permease [Olivibacter sp. SDN3]